MIEQLTELLGQATEADLTTIDERIGELEREAETLKATRKLISIRLGLEPATAPKPRGRPSTEPKENSPSQNNGGQSDPAITKDYATNSPTALARRKSIAKYLIENGATAGLVLASKLGIPHGSITATLAHEWFGKTSDGFVITDSGRTANQ